MLNACRTYLIARLKELALPDDVGHPYSDGEQGNIFFDMLPADYLKENSYAVACLSTRDAEKRSGKMIARTRVLAPTPVYRHVRRRYDREIMFRCLLYAPAFEELWGTSVYMGMAEQLKQGVASNRIIADAGNCAIRIDPADAARPWDSGEELSRKLHRPRLAIVRVTFRGGLQTTEDQAIIPGFTINPHVQ